MSNDRDEAIRLAMECGAGQSEGYDVPFSHFNPEALEAFYLSAKAKGAEEENEACAKVADVAATQAERIGKMHPEESDSRERMFARSREASYIAAEIRARKEKKC